MSDPTEWECVCGETDIMKHDLATAISHLYEIPIEQARDIVKRTVDSILGEDDG